MKKGIFLLVVITLLCLWGIPAEALIRTRNVDADDYGSGESGMKYKVSYPFQTKDAGATLTAATTIPIDITETEITSYVMPFKGSLIGIAIGGGAALTAGSITAEATINGQVTGLRVALDAGASTRHYPSGLLAAHTQYNVQTIAYDNDRPENLGGAVHTTNDYPYGKVTPLEAGDRVGVQLTTSSDMAPDNSNDISVTIMVLQ